MLAAARRKFTELKAGRRVWAVGPVHGQAARLRALSRKLLPALEDGDRLVFLGNLVGLGPDVLGTVDAALELRRDFIARPGAFAADVVFLRGSQEEMWEKLQQVQFAPDPRAVLRWMYERGVDATLEAYGGHRADSFRAAREGAYSLTKWTTTLRNAVQAVPGHATFYSALRRAAFTKGRELLFVHAGIDPTRPLSAQTDTFWWGSLRFAELEAPYEGFRRVICGWHPEHPGTALEPHKAIVDGGCGYGGALVAACFDLKGRLAGTVEV